MERLTANKIPEHKLPVRGKDDVAPNGLYDKRGCSIEQRQWIRDGRDEGRCQFWEFGSGTFRACGLTKQDTRLEVHHIRPQSLQKIEPVTWGGETPYNLITLCVQHHDIMAPHMIAAKETYKYDRDSYTRWIGNAHKALEAGVDLYNHDWDGMLRTVARFRTDFYAKYYGERFPYREERFKKG